MTAMSRPILEAIKNQRAALAACLVVAILLVFAFGAPAGPVAAGCVVAFVYLVLRSRSRPSSQGRDRQV